MDLQKLSQEAFETAKAHGWHDMERPDETHLMLIMTEIAEAVQADRKDKHAYKDKFLASLKPDDDGDMFSMLFGQYIKNSVEDELADIIIRCLDFAALRGVSLDGVTDETQHFHVRDYSLDVLCYALCCHVTAITPLRSKIAGVIAYTLAWCSYNGIDIGFFVEQKMRYNKLREFRHGDKKY